MQESKTTQIPNDVRRKSKIIYTEKIVVKMGVGVAITKQDQIIHSTQELK